MLLIVFCDYLVDDTTCSPMTRWSLMLKGAWMAASSPTKVGNFILSTWRFVVIKHGQYRYCIIYYRYYRGAVGALVVFDISKMSSFENLDKWLGELNEHADPHCCIMIVGNKVDLKHLRAVSMEDGRSLAGTCCGYSIWSMLWENQP